MEFMVLDSKYDAIAIVDAFKSAIWTVRFNTAGDFELYLPASKANMDLFKENRYLWHRDSDRMMIVDTITITTDVENGPMLLVSGESLESILKRRVIANYTTVYGSLQNAIKQILTQEVISPSLSARRIPNFIFKESTDPAVTSFAIGETYFYGETVYDAIVSMCEEKKIGWKILPSGAGGFEFELFAGVDRSYDQTDRPYVVFSPKMENLLGSNYVKTLSNYMNAIYSIGTYQKEIVKTTTDMDGNEVQEIDYEEDNVKTWATSEKSTPRGLNRRETFLDNNDLTGGTKGGTDDHWRSVAAGKGREALQDYKITTAIDGELVGNYQYEYNKDYFLGDIVQVINEFDVSCKSYISEIVFSVDDTGKQIIPTFTSTEEQSI